MEGKENQNSVSLNNAKDKADQRRKQLEEYKRAKQAKKYYGIYEGLNN